ncbi:MAG: hypothetical protein EA402_14135 [Planctomycetota bacterium]|nr:MAG: hypothetical protein EA402_14135 [Planctomycetota bacterium]
MKPTSPLPLIAALLVLLLAGLLIMRSFSLDAQGAGGPLLVSGIFPFTEDYLPSPISGFSEFLSVHDSGQPDLALALPGLRLHDPRQGLEEAPWEEIVIAAEDRHPATAAVIRGLAEILTGQHASPLRPWTGNRYPVVIIQAVEGEALPIGCHRLFRVAAEGEMHRDRSAPMAATVHIAMQDVRGVHQLADAWDLWPARAVREWGLTIEYQQSNDEGDLGWGQRYALLGRRIAGEALSRLVDGGVLGLDADALSLEEIHGPWEGQIPQQPDHDVIRWYASSQAPLIRGWQGVLLGNSVMYRGVVSDTVGVFAAHLLRGDWQALHDKASDSHLERGEWRNSRSGRLQRLWIEAGNHGWDVLTVEPAADSGALFREWLSAAAQGSRSARIQLRRHLLARGIDAELRQSAAELLRQESDIRELALLAERDDATDLELSAREWAHWILGRQSAVPSLPLPERTIQDGDGRLNIGGFGESDFGSGAWLMQQVGDMRELRWRSTQGQPQVWIGRTADLPEELRQSLQLGD